MRDLEILQAHMDVIDMHVLHLMQRLSGTAIISDQGVYLSSAELMNRLKSIKLSTSGCKEILNKMKETEQCE